MSTFTAIDVETANADVSSICQIGVVRFQDGTVHETWSTLVNPQDEFDPLNVSIHGIDQDAVTRAPVFPDVVDVLRPHVDDCIVVCHTPFDRLSLTRVHQKYGLSTTECTWLDSAQVVRRAWPQFARKGYGLRNVAGWLGITFDHHDAFEDARTAGEIILRAVSDSGLSVEE
jgi:DNA polymerase III subunit epsilon